MLPLASQPSCHCDPNNLDCCCLLASSFSLPLTLFASYGHRQHPPHIVSLLAGLTYYRATHTPYLRRGRKAHHLPLPRGSASPRGSSSSPCPTSPPSPPPPASTSPLSPLYKTPPPSSSTPEISPHAPLRTYTQRNQRMMPTSTSCWKRHDILVVVRGVRDGFSSGSMVAPDAPPSTES